MRRSVNSLNNKLLLCTSFMLLVGYTQGAWSVHYAAKAYKGVCFVVRWAPLVPAGILAYGSYKQIQHPQLSFPDSLQDGLRRNHVPLQNEMVNAYLQRIAQSRGLQNILVCKNDQTEISGVDGACGILILGVGDLKTLETYATKPREDLSVEEQGQLDRTEATIHHELTHIARGGNARDFFGKSVAIFAAFPLAEVTRLCLAKYISSRHPAGWLLNTTLYGLTGVASTVLGITTSNSLIKRYEELKADDGIPNEKRLLTAKAADFEADHNNITRPFFLRIEKGHDDERLPRPHRALVRLLGVTTMDSYPWIYELLRVGALTSTYPADITRALRLRKRIARLKEKEQEGVGHTKES
jgi:hypothetical protein